uniref:Uncharacterized protein n=1 Tax=Parascaris equorum TaxID=6256 RepID=A0A914R139_PAREQ
MRNRMGQSASGEFSSTTEGDRYECEGREWSLCTVGSIAGQEGCDPC